MEYNIKHVVQQGIVEWKNKGCGYNMVQWGKKQKWCTMWVKMWYLR